MAYPIRMSGFLKTLQWTVARAPDLGSAEGDRNWHRTEAARHLQSGNLADAERHLILAVREADDLALAPAHRIEPRLELASVQCTLASPSRAPSGTAQLDVAKLRDAESTLHEAILICTQAFDTKLYLRSLDALSDIFCLGEDYPALEGVASDAIRLSAAIPDENTPQLEERLRRLAMAQDKTGRFPDALKTLERAISLREKRYGANHAKTGNLLAEVGQICQARGFPDQAQACLKRALRIHESCYGADSAETLTAVQQLAGALEDAGDVDGAAAQYERFLGSKLRKLGCQNIDDVAEMQYSLACLYTGWGRYSRARELLMECVGTFQRSGGSRLAVAYESLAQVEESEGRVAFALDELQKATNTWEKCVPPRLQELARNLELRAELSEQLRRRVEAEDLRKRARHLTAAAEDQAAVQSKTT
jgi:tetratricopeptide (TPR) repeat protein